VTTLLEVQNLVAGYGAITAVKRLSLTVEAGQAVCLLGPNGAGKTTTLGSIAGLLRPRQGSVRFNGTELVGKTPEEIVALGLSLVPENRLIFPLLTVEENLLAGAYPRLRRERWQVQADVQAILERFPALQERRRQPGGTLSGGEQQMLAIARALMARPRLLMLDEPSLGLAPLLVREIFTILRELHREGRTILLVEQNVRQAMEVSQFVYVLHLGELAFAGTCDDFKRTPNLYQRYLGLRDRA
jgi:branched-chain amino acid transport system ATP-binding protein